MMPALFRIFGHAGFSTPNRDHRDNDDQNHNSYQDGAGYRQRAHQIWCHRVSPRVKQKRIEE
jgi:hypothetical protein